MLGGIACAFVGLCYSELAAMLPVCGSSYTYTYATLGEIFAWIIGWDLILEYAMGAATVAVGWSGYIVSLLHNVGINIPPVLATAPGTVIKLADGTTATGIVNLPAVLIIAILTTMLVLGTKESARLNNIMVAVKLVVVVAFIALGVFFIKPANWHPFIPAEYGRVRQLRHERNSARLGRGVLRVHWLRCGVHCRAGSEKAAARHADRHPRVAGHLYAAVHPGRGRAHRTRALRGAERP